MAEESPSAQEIVDDLIDEVEEEVAAEAVAAAEAIEEAVEDEEDITNDEDDDDIFDFSGTCSVRDYIQKHPAQVALAAFGFACLLGGAGLLLYLRQGKD